MLLNAWAIPMYTCIQTTLIYTDATFQQTHKVTSPCRDFHHRLGNTYPLELRTFTHCCTYVSTLNKYLRFLSCQSVYSTNYVQETKESLKFETVVYCDPDTYVRKETARYNNTQLEILGSLS